MTTTGRPCRCDRCDTNPGAIWDESQCRKCWLYHHDERYRRKWDGDVVIHDSCRHRSGLPTRWQPCPNCPAGVPIYHCGHPDYADAECSHAINTDAKAELLAEQGIMDCSKCSLREPVTFSVKPAVVSYPCVHRHPQRKVAEVASCAGTAAELFRCDLVEGKECTLEIQVPGAALCAACAYRQPPLAAMEWSEEELAAERQALEGPARSLSDQQLRSPVVEEAHRLALAELLQTRLEARSGTGRGIVTLGGGKYFTSAYVLVTVLRQIGCELPIEWWMLDHREADEHMVRLAESLPGVKVRFCCDEFGGRPRSWGGWQAKIWTILWSEFEDVLFLDADQIPIRDPSYLFDDPRYQEHGAILWPDFKNYLGCDIEAQLFRTCGLTVPGRSSLPQHFKPSDYRPVESGQLLLDKSRVGHALEVCRWITDHADYFYRLMYGDKSAFYLAFEATGTKYVQPRACDWLGTAQVGAFIQHDLDGFPLFQHRTKPQVKWQVRSNNPAFKGMVHYGTCLDAIRDLESKWDGVVHRGEPDKGLVGRYRVKWPGREESWFYLNLDGSVSGGTQGASLWSMKEIDGVRRMILHGPHQPLAILSRDGRAWSDPQSGVMIAIQPDNVAIHPHGGDEQLYYDVACWNEYRLVSDLSGAKVLDLGANQGFFALACLDRGVRAIHCYEPSEPNLKLLRQNVGERADVFPQAVGRADIEPYVTDWRHQQDDKQSGGIHLFDDGMPAEGECLVVPIDEQILKLAGMGLVSLMKIDIEGFEWPCLLSSQCLNRVEEIVGEWHLSGVEAIAKECDGLQGEPSLACLKQLLTAWGFTVKITHRIQDKLGHFWCWRGKRPRFFEEPA